MNTSSNFKYFGKINENRFFYGLFYGAFVRDYGIINWSEERDRKMEKKTLGLGIATAIAIVMIYFLAKPFKRTTGGSMANPEKTNCVHVGYEHFLAPFSNERPPSNDDELSKLSFAELVKPIHHLTMARNFGPLLLRLEYLFSNKSDEIAHERPAYLLSLAKAYVECHEPQRALPYLAEISLTYKEKGGDRWSALFAYNVEARLQLVRAYMAMGNYSEMESEGTRLLETLAPLTTFGSDRNQSGEFTWTKYDTLFSLSLGCFRTKNYFAARRYLSLLQQFTSEVQAFIERHNLPGSGLAIPLEGGGIRFHEEMLLLEGDILRALGSEAKARSIFGEMNRRINDDFGPVLHEDPMYRWFLEQTKNRL